MWTDDNGTDDLDRELRELGPLMLQQHQMERRPPDPEFAARLRQRLTGEKPPAPRRSRISPRLWPLFGAAAALAAIGVFFIVRQSNPQSPRGPVTAWHPPVPPQAELTKSYPLTGGIGGGGPGSPTVSRIEVPYGSPYRGHVRLTGTPAAGPNAVHAFRLAGPGFDAPRTGALARAVGLVGPVKHISDYETLYSVPIRSAWSVVSQGGLPSNRPLKSTAVSQRSGQLIYHDFGLLGDQAPAKSTPPQGLALSVARAWLTRLGWPGFRMPIVQSPVLNAPPGVAQIVLGWPGVGSVDTPAAVIWVVSGGRVAEALVLPPVANTTTIPAVTSSTAWRRVANGRYPVGVANMIVAHPPDGIGTLNSTGIIHVFDATSRHLYLIPAYRFAGTARFPRISGERAWFALVPAT